MENSKLGGKRREEKRREKRKEKRRDEGGNGANLHGSNLFGELLFKGGDLRARLILLHGDGVHSLLFGEEVLSKHVGQLGGKFIT